MTDNDVLNDFLKSGALLEGHFQLRSGLHSNRFFQAALVLQHPLIAERLCAELADKFKGVKVDTVLSPALGGLIVGQEVARKIGCRAIFAEKDNDNLVLRRGFALSKGEKVLVAEDVVTKGGRVQQTVQLAKSLGAEVVGIAVIVDRSADDVKFDVPFKSLLKLHFDTFEPAKCPLCSGKVPLVKPGSK
ncbi:MAG TPA: orotate phosphoribosyltransferase [Lentisphaeria bacterium]|nr:MAG: orotate phosphoribosyltransferase [Lentisphaerae bacterium GWF2_49_21]HBC86854.1 orotate phosphoribosyltransferase [Lentisphaeria bacterium]